MTINPMIPLAGRSPALGRNYNNALISGQEYQTAVEQNPLRTEILQGTVDQIPMRNALLQGAVDNIPLNQQALQQKVAAGGLDNQIAQFKLEQERRAAELGERYRTAAFMIPHLDSAMATDDEEARVGILNQAAKQAEAMGIKMPPIGLGEDVSDARLQFIKDSMSGFMDAAKKPGAGTAQKGGTVFARDKKTNTPLIGFPSFSPTDDNAGVRWASADDGAPFVPTDGVVMTDEQHQSPSERSSEEARRAGIKAEATASAQRNADFQKEMSERNVNSARSMSSISEAYELSEMASDGGWTTAFKMKAAYIFPGIDVTNEAALEQRLTEMAMQQLQNFKGPTTDFEFGVAQSIPGTITDRKKARRATLNALARSEWFKQKEFEQWMAHKAAGGHADTFRYNEGAEVKTNSGVFTLKDLRITAAGYHITVDELLKRLNKE